MKYMVILILYSKKLWNCWDLNVIVPFRVSYRRTLWCPIYRCASLQTSSFSQNMSIETLYVWRAGRHLCKVVSTYWIQIIPHFHPITAALTHLYVFGTQISCSILSLCCRGSFIMLRLDSANDPCKWAFSGVPHFVSICIQEGECSRSEQHILQFTHLVYNKLFATSKYEFKVVVSLFYHVNNTQIIILCK